MDSEKWPSAVFSEPCRWTFTEFLLSRYIPDPRPQPSGLLPLVSSLLRALPGSLETRKSALENDDQKAKRYDLFMTGEEVGFS